MLPDGEIVSTHSRPKAAGRIQYFSTYNAAMFQLTAARRRLVIVVPLLCASKLRFNSQPPEGGWKKGCGLGSGRICFNSQPPEGGWQNGLLAPVYDGVFQLTAARRRLGLVHYKQ